MLSKIFSKVRVTNFLVFGKGAVLKATDSAGAETTIDMTELAALNNIAAADLAKIDGITNGTAAAGKALVLGASGEIATITTATVTTLTSNAIAGGDSSLGITGLAAAQGGDVVATGGTSSTGGNAGGVAKIVGGTPGATGVGGAALVIGGAGGATSGAGGVASVTGGAGTGTGATGGAASVTGGAAVAGASTTAGGAGGAVSLVGAAGGAKTDTGAAAGGVGGAASVTSGAGGATASSGSDAGGAGGDIAVTAGAGGNATAGTGNGGAGGSIVLTPGTGGTSAGGTAGKDGAIIERGIKLVKQGDPTAKTVSATLTAAEVLAGIITVNQAAAGASAQQLPTASDFDVALPDAAAGDAFDFSVINTSTVDAEDASVTTNTGWTLVGSMDIPAYSAAGSLNSSARFRARKTGSAAWTLYRIA